jgi:hypothetical protein
MVSVRRGAEAPSRRTHLSTLLMTVARHVFWGGSGLRVIAAWPFALLFPRRGPFLLFATPLGSPMLREPGGGQRPSKLSAISMMRRERDAEQAGPVRNYIYEKAVVICIGCAGSGATRAEMLLMWKEIVTCWRGGISRLDIMAFLREWSRLLQIFSTVQPTREGGKETGNVMYPKVPTPLAGIPAIQIVWLAAADYSKILCSMWAWSGAHRELQEVNLSQV